MTIDELFGKHPAQVVRPGDIVIVTIDRYLTGQQLAELNKHYAKKLPGRSVMVMQKGMEAEVRTPAASDEAVMG